MTIEEEQDGVHVTVNVEQTCSLDGADEDEGESFVVPSKDEIKKQQEEKKKVDADEEMGPNIPIKLRAIDDDIDKTCHELKRLFELLKTADDGGIGKFKTLLLDTDPAAFENWWSTQRTFGPDWMKPLKHIYQFLLTAGQTAAGLATLIMGQACDKDPGPYVLRWIIQFLQRWLGDGVKDTLRQLDYMINYNCPTLIPSTGEANRLYFLGEISAEIWDCWIRMNGDKPDIQQRVVNSMRIKASANDLITLFMRKQIDIDQLRNQGRFAGLRDNFDIGQLTQLRQHWPAIDTIIRFMTRDVFDDRVVQKYNLFSEFAEKYTNKAELLGEAQGFTKDMARLYWAAHWKLPSPTQAYEMMFRLRPGRVAQGVEVTPDDVKDLLGVADYPEYWRDRLVAISHRKLRILDVRRAFFNGQIDRQEMTERGMDIGYSRSDAVKWTALQVLDRLEWWAKQRWGKAYLEGGISEDTLRRKLLARGMPIEDVWEIVAHLKEILVANRLQTCVDALRQRVLIGDLNAQQAGLLLMSAGLDVSQSQELALGWECEKSARLKFEGASKLAGWAVEGLLGLPELVQRLVALGYTEPDIQRITTEIQIKQRENARKVRQRILRQREQSRERRRKEREQQAKAARTAAERALREAEKAQRSRERIAVRERQCTELWAQLVGIDQDDARALLVAQIDRFRKGKRISRLSALDLICGILRDTKKAKALDPYPRLDEAFAALPDPAPPEGAAGASTQSRPPRQAVPNK